nr:hypothetical protein Iba_chr11bCG4030 [Ipomoea batatas]
MSSYHHHADTSLRLRVQYLRNIMGRGAGTESADEQAANQWRMEDGSMKLSFWERPETFFAVQLYSIFLSGYSLFLAWEYPLRLYIRSNSVMRSDRTCRPYIIPDLKVPTGSPRTLHVIAQLHIPGLKVDPNVRPWTSIHSSPLLQRSHVACTVTT